MHLPQSFVATPYKLSVPVVAKRQSLQTAAAVHAAAEQQWAPLLVPERLLAVDVA